MASNNEETFVPKSRTKISFADIPKDLEDEDEIPSKKDKDASKRGSLPLAEGDSPPGDGNKSQDGKDTRASIEDDRRRKKSELEKSNLVEGPPKSETPGKEKGRKEKDHRKNQTEKEPKNKRKLSDEKTKQTEEKRKLSEDKRKQSEDKRKLSEDKPQPSEDQRRQSEEKRKKERSRSSDVRRTTKPLAKEESDKKFSDDTDDATSAASYESIITDEEEGEKEELEGESYQVISKSFYHERYAEEYMGEGYYSSPSPSDEYLLSGRKDTKTSDKKSGEGREQEYEGEMQDAMEDEEKEEDLVIEQLVSKAKAEIAEKASLATIGSFDYGTRISEYFIQQKVKTPSEIRFENEYREAIEEKMKKSMHPAEEEQEKVFQDRKPVEKKKVLLNELDMSGLYPQPKVIVSEISFAFDEDEEGEKVGRGTQTDVDVIMELLRQSLRQDADSIFAKNARDSIQKVRSVVEEILTIMKRGVPVEVGQKVNESLPNLKTNLKINLIFYLQQTFETMKLREEEEEDKPAETAEKKTKKVKRKARQKSKKIEEALKEETEGEIEEGEIKELKMEEKPTDEAMKLAKKRRALEKEEEGEGEEEEEEWVEEEEEEEEVPAEPVIPYEKIDWNAYLTESERQLSIDPRLRSEMELYIAEKKKELIAEQERRAEIKKRKMRFKKISDQQELLRIINLNVTMKFVLNNGNTFTCAYRYFMSFKEIKEDLAGIFKVPPELFVIYRDDIEVKDEQTAYHLVPPVEPFDTVTFRLVVSGGTQCYELKSDHLDIPVPDIITCCVEMGKDHNGVPEYKEVVVEIENRQIKKPYVGGYRDRSTGIEYHHAFSQSGPPPQKLPPDQQASRNTQTTFENEKLVDTTSHKATQMARRDYYVSTENDKIITAKPYVDYETLSKKKNFDNKVRTIQRYIRAMILRKYLKERSEEYRRRKCWEIEEEKKRVLERENRIKSDIINMTYPKTRADFDMLYALVEKWRRAQIKRISELKTEAPKKAELCGVLEKEIKLLEAIEVHRIAVSKKQKEIKAINFMKKLSKPIAWTGYRGMTIKMDTLKTQRARELKELYQSLARHDLPYQDRIELLISLKHALRNQNTTLTEELTNLINQECEMLIRGVPAKSLEYLRQRIEHLFKEYFKDPYFNPEAAKYDPMFHKEALKNMVFCKMCHQMKQLKDFTANTRSRGFHVCAACHWIYNIAVPRVDLGPYRYILKLVRKDEQKRNCYSSCAFVLQEEDMRFLIQNIWMNKSIVSENDNVIDLRMPRWNVKKEWSPWNCILLTEIEAKAHLKTNPYDNFESDLISEIVSKHELARSHFKQLYRTTAKIEDSGKWANAVDLKEYVPPLITGDFSDMTPAECLKLKTGNLYEVHEWPMGNDTMKSKMEIDPTTQRDAGYYECQADNQYAIDRRGFRTDYVIYTY